MSGTHNLLELRKKSDKSHSRTIFLVGKEKALIMVQQKPATVSFHLYDKPLLDFFKIIFVIPCFLISITFRLKWSSVPITNSSRDKLLFESSRSKRFYYLYDSEQIAVKKIAFVCRSPPQFINPYLSGFCKYASAQSQNLRFHTS